MDSLSIMPVILKLIAVIAALLGVAALSARWLRKGSFAGEIVRRQGNVHLLERHYLGPRHSLQVVQIPERVLLLGVSEGHIELLAEVKADSWPPTPEPKPAIAFDEILGRLWPPKVGRN